jgi:uncharacterized phage protein gp47/JayE
MPFSRPLLTDLIGRIAADIESRLTGADAKLRRSFLNVLSRVMAGSAHGLYGHLDFLAKQIIPDTAEAEYLERWASIWGIFRKPAAAARGDITFSGTDGVTIPAGTVLQRSDGAEFSTDADGTVAAGTTTVACTAAAAGEDGKTPAGSQLTLVNPIAGIDATALVETEGLSGGVDVEADAALLVRLLARIQQPPHGGAEFDYEAWALEVAGVTRAWVYPAELGLGTVTVRFMMDDAYADGIPQAADVAIVQAYLDTVRPVTADVTVVAPVAVPLALTIELTPNTAAVQEAVETEIRDLLLREAIPEDGNGAGTILLSHIREAISIAAGETDHVLVSPVADVIHDQGEIATLGVITWA